MPVKRLLVLCLVVLAASSAFAGTYFLRSNALPANFEAGIADTQIAVRLGTPTVSNTGQVTAA